MRPISSHFVPRWVGFVVILWLTCAPSPIFSQNSTDLPSAIVRVSEELDLDAVGNAIGRAEIVLPTETYQKMKLLMSPRYTVQENGQQVVKLKAPKIENVIRYLGITSTASEIQELKGEFDDDAATILISYRILGRVGYHQGHWSIGINKDPDIQTNVHQVEIRGESAALELRTRIQGLALIMRLKLNLPAGATKIEFHQKSFELVYDLPLAKPADDKPVQRLPEMRFDAKPQLMSAIYKLYGNPKWLELWAARSIFQNDTAEVLSDYRVRFRIEGYSNWSPWKRSERIIPGQTVVDAFYPIIDSKITQLKGTTPGQVELEYEYIRPNGQKVTETESGSIKLLGMNDALWSSLELDENSTWFDIYRNGPMVLASFTSATDPVILDVLGVVSKAAGGSGHKLSDEAALRFMGTLYNLFRQNIAYETTAAGLQGGLVHQHLKYGRDVLRTRSGTCVNLAILYASACEAVGLDAMLILGPGHVFAAARLPDSGLPVFVETTGCGGGTKETSMTFVQARESAYRTYQQWYANGEMYEVDIQAMRRAGIPSPELPDLGPNPLKEWGIQQPDAVDQVYLPKLLVNVKAALDAVQLKYSLVPGKSAVQLYFNTNAGNQWLTVIETIEDAEVMVVRSNVPGNARENQRQSVAVFLAENNSNFYHGDFELTKDGVVSFRTSTDVRGGLLAAKMVQNEVDIHFRTMEKNLPELRKLVVLPTESGAPQQTAGAHSPPAQTTENQVLVGRWKTAYRDASGNLIAQGVILAADGKFLTIATTSNGISLQLKGHWTYKDNILTAIYENQQTLRGLVRIVSNDRVIFHDPTLNIDLTYDRIPEDK